MVKNVGDYSESGSDSESNRSGTPPVALTPGYSLEHHDSRSNSPRNSSNHSSQRNRSKSNSRSKSRSRSRSQSRSRSNSVHSVGKPNNSNHQESESRSQSPNLQIDAGSDRSRSGSRSRSRSHSTSLPRSRSGSHPRSRSGSRPRSKSVSKSRSRSRTPARSRSGSRHRSVSSGRSRKSRSRSRSNSIASNHSRKSSRSHSRSPEPHSNDEGDGKSDPSIKNRSRSRSRSPKKTEPNDTDKRKRNILSSDSGSEADSKVKKRRSNALIDSDSEEEIPKMNEIAPQDDVTANKLFGDADDISTDEEAEKGHKSDKEDNDKRDSDHDSMRIDSDRRSSDEEEKNYDDEQEKEPEPEPIPETRIDVEIPRIVSDLGRDIHFVKLPNFLSVETRPFDPETYEDEIDEEETLDEEGRQRIKLKVSNTIRWREFIDDSGNHVKDSNARVVKWSDGSMSLHLGNEIFDVYKQPLQGDHNHLFIRQGTGLQGQAVFRTKLTFRPHSTESFTHKKMTMSLADRSQKTSGIKILTQVGDDPDQDRQYNLKKEEEKLRQAMRQRHQTKPKRSRGEAGVMHNLLYRDHDEGSEDESGISIAAIKNKYKKNGSSGKSGAAIYSSDEEESDFETRPKKNIDKTKVLKALKDSDDESDSGSGAEDKSHDEGDDDVDPQ